MVRRADARSKRKRKHLARRKPKPLSSKPWILLNPSEKSVRIRSLEVKRHMKANNSLSHSAELAGVDYRTAKNNLKPYLHKIRGRWKLKKSIDKIQRGMILYSKAKIRTIIVADSEEASIIGQYFNDLKLVLLGDVSRLNKYKNVKIVDADGRKHPLETDLDKIKEIELGRENLEMVDIYDLE